MKIIDAHAHVFESLRGFNGKGEMIGIGGGEGRWASGEVCKMVPPDLGEYAFTYDTCYKLMRENGVQKAVLLQGNYYGFQNEYVKKAVETHPDMFIGAGCYDPFGLFADQVYDHITNDLKFKILKFECSSGCGLTSLHGRFSIKDVFFPIAEKCMNNKQVIVLDLGSPGMESFQPDKVREIAQSFPELRIVICHLLAPKLKDEEELKRALNLLAINNVWFDISAIPFNVLPELFPYPTGLKFIKDAKDIVGMDKLMWGTDLPSVLWYATYAQLRDYILKADFLTEEEKEKLFWKNAEYVYPFNELENTEN